MLTRKQLENDLDASRKNCAEARANAADIRNKNYSLEEQVRLLTKQLERAQEMETQAVQLYGRLLGYQERVREEDAKTLGKLWHEAQRHDSFGNIIP